MNFGTMVAMLQNNNLAIARREGWNGKGMAIALMPKQVVPADKITDRTAALLRLIEDNYDASESLPIEPYFAMYTAAHTWQPGWVASQADMLADDWQVLIDEWRS